MRMKTAITFFVCIAMGALIFALFFVWNSKLESKSSILHFSHSATVGQTQIFVAFARTQRQQITGLSGQKSLGDNQGLLFVFDKPNYYGIWMKDMNFPIDVIWFSPLRRIIFMKEDFLPSSYPQVVAPSSETNLVLEVPAGFAQSHQIGVGDEINF